MTREEQLNYCSICKHQQFRMNIGIVCRLTDNIADFEDACENYEEDTELMNRLHRKKVSIDAKTAGISKRFVNYIIDSIAISILYLLILYVVGIIFIKTNPEILNFLLNDSQYLNYLLFIFVMLGYYFLFESFTGRTIGKYITKTTVVDKEGRKPVVKIVFIRTICRLIPFELLSYLGEGKLGWHDTLSGTTTIDK